MAKRPRGGVRMSVRIDNENYVWLRGVSDETGIPMNFIINRALKLYFEAHKHLFSKGKYEEWKRIYLRGG